MHKLLYVTTVCPLPERSGGRQRTMMTLSRLARSFRVTLLFPDGPGVAEALPALAALGLEPVVGLPRPERWRGLPDAWFGGYPLPFAPFVKALEREFLRLFPGHHLIWFDHLHGTPLLRDLDLGHRLLVLDEHNIECNLYRAWGKGQGGWRAWGAALLARSLERFERKILAAMDLVLVATDADRDWLVAAGVDPARIQRIANGAHRPLRIPPAARERRVLYCGALDWQPNVDAVECFCREVWSRLRDRLYDPGLIIAGSCPVPRIRRLVAADSRIELIENYRDSADLYRRANVAVVPSFLPGGMKIKSVEALLYGRHLVSTVEGAAGLPTHPGLHVRRNLKGFLPLLDKLLADNRLPAPADECLTGLDWQEIGRRFERNIVPRLHARLREVRRL